MNIYQTTNNILICNPDILLNVYSYICYLFNEDRLNDVGKP
jgi:hypothetical protein